ncbi:MAG: cobalamin B12-binding domain-containing protein [archaeon]|nr:cobalamin B12-binding domain-containing protein [archaeon]MCP8313053.1 cobalamin B12-binding domain-containing protein [archaeon]MCP8321620.1 cobalamin-dependent protein [archaeon]
MTDNLLEEEARTILLGDSEAAINATRRALDNGLNIEDIILRGVLKAWMDYSEWYHRDPDGALSRWSECYIATHKVLRLLEARISPTPNPLFTVLVITVKGEGHIVVKDLLTVLLKAKGLKVYEMRKGVVIEEILEHLSDPSLKFVIISCTQEETRESIIDLIERIREIRSDLKIVTGGPIAEGLGADIVISDPSKLFDTLIDDTKSNC